MDLSKQEIKNLIRYDVHTFGHNQARINAMPFVNAGRISAATMFNVLRQEKFFKFVLAQQATARLRYVENNEMNNQIPMNENDDLFENDENQEIILNNDVRPNIMVPLGILFLLVIIMAFFVMLYYFFMEIQDFSNGLLKNLLKKLLLLCVQLL